MLLGSPSPGPLYPAAPFLSSQKLGRIFLVVKRGSQLRQVENTHMCTHMCTHPRMHIRMCALFSVALPCSWWLHQVSFPHPERLPLSPSASDANCLLIMPMSAMLPTCLGPLSTSATCFYCAEWPMFLPSPVFPFLPLFLPFPLLFPSSHTPFLSSLLLSFLLSFLSIFKKTVSICSLGWH